jgi:anthranilate phosphoribosyltransferase
MTEGTGDAALRRGLGRLVRGEVIDEAEALALFRELVAGAADPAQIGGLLIGLAIRGESAAVIAGAVRAMREAVVAVPVREPGAIDTCGTGGSGVPRRNVSTAVAIAAAACGARVAKHGNRGISSPCGSADVLAALGVDITAPPERVGRCVDEVGVGFMFAPNLHPAMRHAAGPRRALGLRTLFNLVGPMCNPAGVRRQVIGVFDPAKVEPMAAALGALGSERVFVVHGGFAAADRPGIDDLSPEGPSTIAEWHRGALRTYTLRPADAGLPEVPIAAIAGDDADGNARALRGLLAGESGAYRTSVQYSGALALLAAGDDGLDTLPVKARAIGAALADLVAASRAALP